MRHLKLMILVPFQESGIIKLITLTMYLNYLGPIFGFSLSWILLTAHGENRGLHWLMASWLNVRLHFLLTDMTGDIFYPQVSVTLTSQSPTITLNMDTSSKWLFILKVLDSKAQYPQSGKPIPIAEVLIIGTLKKNMDPTLGDTGLIFPVWF